MIFKVFSNLNNSVIVLWASSHHNLFSNFIEIYTVVAYICRYTTCLAIFERMKHSGTLHSVSYMNTVHSIPNGTGCYRKTEIVFSTRVQKLRKHLMFLKCLISALVLQFSKTEAHSSFSPSYQPTLTQMLN